MKSNTPSENATSRFEQGFSCSQSVFSVFAPEFGLSEEAALKIASAFGGGMVRQGEVCGAVTGGLMALGLKYGSDKPDDEDAVRQASQEFMRRFREKNGFILCRELLGHKFDTPEGLATTQESGVFNTICPNLVQNATQLTTKFLTRKNSF